MKKSVKASTIFEATILTSLRFTARKLQLLSNTRWQQYATIAQCLGGTLFVIYPGRITQVVVDLAFKCIVVLKKELPLGARATVRNV